MLYKEYGHCIIPKNTTLFRGGKAVNYSHCMFFELVKHVANAFTDDSDFVQVWKTKQDIKVLFVVSELNDRSHAKSSLMDLYKKLLPNELVIDDFDLKYNDVVKRSQFIQKLKQEGVTGWLSSVEDRSELEICLFPDNRDFEDALSFQKLISSKDEKEFAYENALIHIDFFPSESFFVKTKIKLKDSPFKKYKSLMDNWITHEMKNGTNKEQAEKLYFQLRQKLQL